MKSIGQYKKERLRRRQVKRLSSEGFSYRQIAEKLGISTKTVQQDLKKLWPYVLGKLRQQTRKIERERIQELDQRLDGMTLHQRLNYLTEEIAKQIKLRNQLDHYHRHNFKIRINLDDMTDGLPSITTWPKPPFFIHPDREGYSMHFVFVKNGKEINVGSLKVR